MIDILLASLALRQTVQQLINMNFSLAKKSDGKKIDEKRIPSKKVFVRAGSFWPKVQHMFVFSPFSFIYSSFLSFRFVFKVMRELELRFTWFSSSFSSSFFSSCSSSFSSSWMQFSGSIPNAHKKIRWVIEIQSAKFTDNPLHWSLVYYSYRGNSFWNAEAIFCILFYPKPRWRQKVGPYFSLQD